MFDRGSLNFILALIAIINNYLNSIIIYYIIYNYNYIYILK